MMSWSNPALVAAGIAVVMLLALLKRAHALPLDQPNHRSLHTRPTPRIGGLALFPAVLVGAWSGGLSNDESLLLACAAGLFALSIADDRHDLPVKLRLSVHLLLSGLAAYLLFGATPWLIPAALALGWMTNLYNFMDGANGLAGGMAALGFAGLAAASHDVVLAAAVVGAACGFLLFNFDPARVFLGDAGSIPLGFLAGGLGLQGVAQGQWPLWYPLLAFSPFIVDASVTLLRRAWRREKVWQAHREHYFQRLIRMGWSHRRLALAEYALMSLCGLSAYGMLRLDSRAQMLGLALWGAIYLILIIAIDRRWRALGEKA